MKKIDILVDSGAFSAWKLGKPVDLDRYCAYLLANEDWISAYVALDHIDPTEPETAARISFQNYERMLKKGLKPIPVYHVHEKTEWLHRMIDAGADYIGLSASSLVNRHAVDDWYASAWKHLVTPEGLPTIRAHAFGEGRHTPLKRYPWYSADSTSWLYKAQRNGFFPIGEKHAVATRNDRVSLKGAPDMDRLDAEDKAALEAYFRSIGLSGAVLADRSSSAAAMARTYISAHRYIELQAEARALHPIRFRPGGFFAGECRRPPVSVDPGLRMNLVIGTNFTAYAALYACRHPYALVSYFDIVKSDVYHPLLKQFATDPDRAVCEQKKLSRDYNLLKDHIVHEEPRPRGRSRPF